MLRRILGVALLASALAVGGSAAAWPSKKDLEKWRLEREARGVYNFVKLYPETSEIEFTYGGPEHRRMSFTDFAAFVRSKLSDQTITTGPSQVGYQVEYYGADGKAYLWYPGNKATNVGRYVVRPSMEPVNIFGDKAGVVICFDYGPDSYNPSTGKLGAEECQSAYAFIAGIRGKRPGDVFSLAGGQLPYVTTRDSVPTWPDKSPLVDPKAPHQ